MEGLEILSAIPDLESKKRAWEEIKTYYSEILLDTDQHPVVFDQNGVLRFKEDTFLVALQRAGVLDLNAVYLAVARNQLTREQQRKISKSIGYSLDGYFGLSYVQEWCKEINGEEEEEEEEESIDKRARTE